MDGGIQTEHYGSYGVGGYTFGNSGGAGGGGYYGGSFSHYAGGSGGSSFINTNLITNASMYCHNCDESNVTETLTYNTNGTQNTYLDKTNCSTGYSNDPISKCSKLGDGHARITLISLD